MSGKMGILSMTLERSENDEWHTCNTSEVFAVATLGEGAAGVILRAATEVLHITVDAHLLPGSQHHHLWPANRGEHMGYDGANLQRG